jgi:phosphoglycerate dehydrogenase-like enzyme
MRIIGINTDGRPVEFCDATHTLADLPRLLPESDAVILTIPVTEKTEYLFDRAMLGCMKKTAFLVNVSRGTLIKEDDLIAALRDKTIAGVGLDTFEKEPLPAESPLWGMENAIITPHVSGGFRRYHARVMDVFLENLDYFMRGEYLTMPGRANEKGY